MYSELPIIETPRLLLREINIIDCEDMYEYAKSPLVGPVAGWEPHRHLNDTKNVIQMFKDKKKYGQLGVYAIILKSENKMIGTLELHTYIRGYKAELGYTVNPRYWGRGIAVEASLEALRLGFISLGLKRIECTTFVQNGQSRRVCEKLKLTYEGIRKKGYMLYDGSLHDIYAYAITDDEYFKIYGYRSINEF
jgi:RimJ/RimL family protein N-acetyltransferase